VLMTAYGWEFDTGSKLELAELGFRAIMRSFALWITRSRSLNEQMQGPVSPNLGVMPLISYRRQVPASVSGSMLSEVCLLLREKDKCLSNLISVAIASLKSSTHPGLRKIKVTLTLKRKYISSILCQR
jgi:hypothetical protein